MKIIVVASCLIALTWCAPTSVDLQLRFLPAINQEQVHDEFGQYAFRYVTAEKTVVSERGWLVPTEDGDYVLEIEGQYQFIGDDGQLYVTHYTGGPNGSQMEGNHLPQPIPVPVVIEEQK